MNKTQLIESLAEKGQMTKAAAGRILDDLIEVVQDTLAKGEDVSVVGFGRFMVKKTEARAGRNPQTGEKMSIPAKQTPRFIPGSAFRAAVAVKAKKSK